MTNLIKLMDAVTLTKQAREAAIKLGCAAHVEAVNAAIGSAVNSGHDRCKVVITHITLAERESLIKLVKSGGYEAADVSSIKPQDPFELDIRWHTPA